MYCLSVFVSVNLWKQYFTIISLLLLFHYVCDGVCSRWMMRRWWVMRHQIDCYQATVRQSVVSRRRETHTHSQPTYQSQVSSATRLFTWRTLSALFSAYLSNNRHWVSCFCLNRVLLPCVKSERNFKLEIFMLENEKFWKVLE